MHTADIELNCIIWPLAKTWTRDATSLAYLALFQSGQAPSPTVDTELLERAVTLAEEALDEARETETPEPAPRTTFTMPMDPKLVGRTLKALARQCRWPDGRTMILGERLAETALVRKSEYVRRYARKKRNGCYAELSTPKHEYTVWYLDENGRESGYDVPKIVYDALPDLPVSSSAE